MSATSNVTPIRLRNTGHVRFKTSDLPDRKTLSQKSGGKSQQMNSDIGNSIRQFRKSTDTRLDYEIDNDGKKISVRVINKASGKIVDSGSVKMI